ncbi:hypothetical protein Tco_0696706 [Tanacetum coccineum]
MVISSSSSTSFSSNEINNLNIKLEKVVKERDELKLKIEKWEGSSKNLTKILNSQMSAHDKNGLGFGTQIDKLSKLSETNSENSMTVFEVRSSDEESTLGNSRVKNITTVRSRAVVSKGKVENVLEKAKWVWRPKVNYQDYVYKYTGFYMLKKFEYVDQKGSPKSVIDYGSKRTLTSLLVVQGNPEYVLQDHAVVDSGCSSHMTGNKAYLSDYEDFNGGFVAFGSDPKGGRITGKALNFLMKVKLYLELLGKHNMVAFLKKPNESVGFTEVVDFLKGTSLRSKLQLADATGVNNLSDADIYAGLATLGDELHNIGSNTIFNVSKVFVQGYAGDIVPLLPAMLVGAAVDQERELHQTKTIYGQAVLTLVERVKILEKGLKRKIKKLIISESEDEELEDQGRKIKDIDDDPLVTLVRESMKDKDKEFVTPTKGLGEAQESEISPITLEAAKTLSKVASQGVSKGKSTDKGKRYRRRARSVANDISTGIEAQRETNNSFDDINTGFVEINIGSTKVSTGSIPVSTASKVGQREGKAPMIEEDIQATLKTKETKMVEEEALSEQQEKRKAQVQFEAQYYTEEDWDAIKAKLEANAELTKDVLGKDFPEEDFAKRMVEMVNQIKKHFAEEKAKAKRDKPMTQSQLRTYMSNYLKNQGTWKLSQLKKLSFKEIKEEFDKLVHQIGTFVPMESEASVKRQEKDKVVKDEEAEVLVKKVGMRRKQKARKGIKIDKAAQDKSKEEREAFMKENIKGASSE